jgi:hypothetical protein
VKRTRDAHVGIDGCGPKIASGLVDRFGHALVGKALADVAIEIGAL